MTKIMTALIAVALTASAIAGETQNTATKIPSLQSGKCKITLLDADGIKPLAGAELTLKSAKSGEAVLTSTANDAGLCVVDIKDGRYILSVNDTILSLLDASKDGDLAWCRIVVSEKPMLVGGQEAAVVTPGFTFLGLHGGAAVGAAAAAGAVGAGAVAVGGDYADAWDIDGIDNSNDKKKPSPTSP